MDRQGAVHKRKKRYMAQLLDDFERNVEPHLPPDVAENYKRQVRRKMNALAVDACEQIRLKPGVEMNGEIFELRDQLRGGGQPTKRSVRA